MPSRSLSLSPRAFERICAGALVALAAIVVTGGAVRLTGSGLGCPDWPTCASGRVVAPLEYHALVEFTNRVVTGLVSLAVIVAVLGSLLRVPRRRDLVWLSLGLVAGVVGQIVLGGLVVLFHLWPPLVMGHFAVSMALLADAVVLLHRAGRVDGSLPVAAASTAERALARALVAGAAVVILLGTVVTGSGPHAGSNEGELVERLPFALRDVARLHGAAVLWLITVAVVLAVRVVRTAAAPAVVRSSRVLVVVLVAQAAVGYAQYFLGVPPLLVAVHIAGAAAVWIAVIRLLLGMRVWVPR